MYPNPVEGDEGAFVYELNRSALEAQVTIYTTSGRRVLRDDAPTRAGRNAYRWDLRDSAGDRVANGVYLLVLRVEDPEGSAVSHLERVAITR